MGRRGVRLALLLLAAVTLAWPQEFVGKLDKKLGRTSGGVLAAWRTQPWADMPFPYTPGDELYNGWLRLGPSENDRISVSATESPRGDVHLYVDLNGDRKLDKRERFRFRRLRSDPAYEQEAFVEIPLRQGHFRSFKVRFMIPRRGRENICSGFQRAVLVEADPVVVGHADAHGRTLRAAWFYSIAEGAVKPDWRQGLDGNFDGRVNFEVSSPENDYGQSPIFRAGERYYSTAGVDLNSGSFLLRQQAPGEYNRIELLEGATLPVFTFEDFDGVSRSSAEYRGRWLLIHFWEYPCGPCLQDFSFLRQAWECLRSRGLELLGVYGQAMNDKARDVVRDHRAAWTHARGDSLGDFKDRLRIYAWPTIFLVDPQGRIALVNRWPEEILRGEQILRTLTAKLPLGAGCATQPAH